MGKLISLGEWAEKNKIDPATARQRAGRGAFETAQKIGRNWVIDSEEKLIDHRRRMKMKVKELLKKEKYTDWEVYQYTDRTHRVHTDFVRWIGDMDFEKLKELEVQDYYIMGEDEYNETIRANTDHEDFESAYGEKEATVLVIITASVLDE